MRAVVVVPLFIRDPPFLRPPESCSCLCECVRASYIRKSVMLLLNGTKGLWDTMPYEYIM
jgi:hypothetical protein